MNRGNYTEARGYTERLLAAEPANRQALQLQEQIEHAVYRGTCECLRARPLTACAVCFCVVVREQLRAVTLMSLCGRVCVCFFGLYIYA